MFGQCDVLIPCRDKSVTEDMITITQTFAQPILCYHARSPSVKYRNKSELCYKIGSEMMKSGYMHTRLRLSMDFIQFLALSSPVQLLELCFVSDIPPAAGKDNLACFQNP
jgi:hypothetical protein